MRNFSTSGVKYRILVTGSRGKSSLVRLLFAGMASRGLKVRARITGVLPRELSPIGERTIERNSPGHVLEMRWWLEQIPRDTDAVVMENSAVAAELQPLAARWLQPTLIVWTNSREDHQEIWGKGGAAAEAAILCGVPGNVSLVVGGEVMRSANLKELFARRTAPVTVAEGYQLNYRRSNMGLARKVLENIGLLNAESERAMELLQPDVGDFRVFCPGGGTLLAAAFSANDIVSTEHLFSLLGWREKDTSLFFSHRADRPERRASFDVFLKRNWREVEVLKDSQRWERIHDWMNGKQVFGCGNIAGAPLALLRRLLEDGCKWTIPGA